MSESKACKWTNVPVWPEIECLVCYWACGLVWYWSYLVWLECLVMLSFFQDEMQVMGGFDLLRNTNRSDCHHSFVVMVISCWERHIFLDMTVLCGLSISSWKLAHGQPILRISMFEILWKVSQLTLNFGSVNALQNLTIHCLSNLCFLHPVVEEALNYFLLSDVL